MYSNNDRVSYYQIINILVLTLIGVGILTLPRDLVEIASTDGWVILLGGGILAMGIAALHGYIVKSFPGKGYFEILCLTLTKPIAYLLTVFFIIYLIGTNGFLVRIFAEVVKVMLLPHTPIEMIIFAMLLTVIYLVREGLEPLGRLTNIIFPTSVIIVLILFGLTLGEVDTSNIRPILQTPPLQMLKALDIVIFSFLGFEMLLVFGAYIDKPQKATRIGPLAVGAVLIFYLLLNFSVLLNFGPAQTENLIWPTISVFKTIDLPGAFIENVEVAVMAIWVFTVFTTLDSFFLGITILLKDVCSTKEHNYFVLPVLPFIYFISMYSISIGDVYQDFGIFSDYTAYIILSIPLLILLVMAIKKVFKKDGKESI
ncbi:MAG: endospore germination permease [Clostridiaceae bacterium]|nr:endospore germination permease [Clostridiaceae bacterium]